MRKKRKLILKYLLLISVMLLMMLLCACRVRLTNNTDVSSTIADEDGWMKDNYQMRRDQLGEPVAERPIFTGWGSDDSDDDYYDTSTDAFDDYDPNAIDEWEEPEAPSNLTNTGSSTPSSSSSSSSSSSGSSSRKKSGSSSESSDDEDVEEKKPEEPKPDPVIEIIVEFDANGGYVEKAYKKVVSGSTYGDLPTPTRDDTNQFFIGWFTAKDGGSLVTAESTVESEEPVTLYAHWGTNYPFVLKPDGGLINNNPGDVQAKSDKGLYPALPVPVKNGFHFMGWYLEDGKTKVESGQECKSSQSLTARWVENAKYWEDRYAVASNNEAFTDTFTADDTTIAKGAAPAEGENPGFRIAKCNGEYNKENADATQAAEAGKYTKAVLVVPANIYDSDNSKKLYRLILLKQMYGDASTITDEEITQAAAELGITLTDPPLYRYDVEPAQ